MLQSRPVRGYLVLLFGIALFIGLRLMNGAPLMAGDPQYAHIANEVEPQIIVVTALLAGIALGWGSVRGILIATAFVIPPLLLYFTFYPLWVIMLMLLLVPILTHAALGAWMPTRKAS